MMDPLAFLGIQSANPFKSIIKKVSTLKTSEEIERLKAQAALLKQKALKKVTFQDLRLIDNVDEYITAQESGYHKITKLRAKSHSPVDKQDALARKDGVDKSMI